MNESAAPPLLTEIQPATHKAIGIITLNRPRVLNAFNVDMAKLLYQTLSAWAENDDIALVVLKGAGPKGFCAGGDVRRVIEHLRSDQPRDQLVKVASHYFASEYRADYAIHQFPKPILAWGHGLVFGGGWGLFAGASHRIATPSSQFSMPEILIGLFPDVAASWFLNRLPHGIGLFLGMTAARINARDALSLDLADHLLAEDGLAGLLAQLTAQSWRHNPGDNATLLHNILQEHALPHDTPGQLTPHLPLIQNLNREQTLEGYCAGIQNLATDDPWLMRAKAQFAKGSPSSAALIYQHLKQTRHYSLKQCFELDWQLVMHCSFHHDFHEGIRALLIDKDQNPQWVAKALADVDRGWVKNALATPFPDSENPLKTLLQ